MSHANPVHTAPPRDANARPDGLPSTAEPRAGLPIAVEVTREDAPQASQPHCVGPGVARFPTPSLPPRNALATSELTNAVQVADASATHSTNSPGQTGEPTQSGVGHASEDQPRSAPAPSAEGTAAVDRRLSTGLAVVTSDAGRVQLVAEWEPWLRAAGLTTLAAFRGLRGESVRKVDSRETLRVEIPQPKRNPGDTAPFPAAASPALMGRNPVPGSPEAGPLVVYLKRHGPPHWRERIVPWLRGARPILGATAEWEALGHLAQHQIPTMQPVAYGADARGSFVMTVALPARCDLKAWLREQALGSRDSGADRVRLTRVVDRLADMIRTLHTAGLHHQDLYLNHVLWCGPEDALVPDLRLIDLGRVVQRARLSRRWRVKDLAQLHYSAAGVPCREMVRFLRLYLGRRLHRRDRPLIRSILRKSARIDRHTRRHGL